MGRKTDHFETWPDGIVDTFVVIVAVGNGTLSDPHPCGFFLVDNMHVFDLILSQQPVDFVLPCLSNRRSGCNLRRFL